MVAFLSLFTPDGRMPDESILRKDIFRVLSRYIRCGLETGRWTTLWQPCCPKKLENLTKTWYSILV